MGEDEENMRKLVFIVAKATRPGGRECGRWERIVSGPGWDFLTCYGRQGKTPTPKAWLTHTLERRRCIDGDKGAPQHGPIRTLRAGADELLKYKLERNLL